MRCIALPHRRLLVLLFASTVAASHSQVVNLAINPANQNDAAVAELISSIRTATTNGLTNTINLFPNGVYTLTQPENWEYGPNGLPQICGHVILNGQGATIRRATNAPKFRFLYVSGGLSYDTNTGSGLAEGDLTVNQLTFYGGLAKGGDGGGGGGAGMGGAIFNQGTVTLNGVAVIGCTAKGGLGGGNAEAQGLGFGGGGIGGDSLANAGGGFGGVFLGLGGIGGIGNQGAGGGGGFRPVDAGFPGYNTNSNIGNGAGGGLGGLDGGAGGSGSGPGGGANGGDYGFGGNSITGSTQTGFGGGGGIGGGGGFGGFSAGTGGFGGGGGSDYWATGGKGGFGGGGGGGNGAPAGGFSGGRGGYNGGGGGGMGGAIFNHQGRLYLACCNLAFNNAAGANAWGNYSQFELYPQGGSGYGGAIFNLNGFVSILGSQIISNSACAGSNYEQVTIWDGGLITTNEWVATGASDAEALYNLAHGNRIEDGLASIATVNICDSILAGFTGSTTALVNDLHNGNRTNIAIVGFSGTNLVTSQKCLASATVTGPPACWSSAMLVPTAGCKGRTVQFNVFGVVGHQYAVQSSPDMNNFLCVSTNTAPFTFTDTNCAGSNSTFYRAVFVQ